MNGKSYPGNAGTVPVNAAQHASPTIQEELSLMQDELQALMEAVSYLADRVSPVLCEMEVDGQAPHPHAVELPDSPMGHKLRERTEFIKQIRRIVVATSVAVRL